MFWKFSKPRVLLRLRLLECNAV